MGIGEDRSIRTSGHRKSLESGATSRIRKNDILDIDGPVRVEDVESVEGGYRVNGRFFSEHGAADVLLAREEDLASSITRELRFQESMLRSQIVLMGDSKRQGHMEWWGAMRELERTLYVVREMLRHRGARESE